MEVSADVEGPHLAGLIISKLGLLEPDGLFVAQRLPLFEGHVEVFPGEAEGLVEAYLEVLAPLDGLNVPQLVPLGLVVPELLKGNRVDAAFPLTLDGSQIPVRLALLLHRNEGGNA